MNTYMTRFGLLFAVFLIRSLSAFAASVEVVGGESCDLILRGPVQRGDSARLAELVETRSETRLCLDSPGGSYGEGLELAKTIFKLGVQTVIDDGMKCYSACAIAFMAGRRVETAEEEDGAWPSRTLNVGGHLGFHAPFTKSGGQANITNEQLDAQFARGVYALAELLAIAPQLNIAPELVVELARRGPAEIYDIDTVDKVGRWGISLFGVERLSEAISPEQAVLACSNMFSWSRKKLEAGMSYEECKELDCVQKVNEGTIGSIYKVSGMDDYTPTYCVVQTAPPSGAKLSLVQDVDQNAFDGAYQLEGWEVFSPSKLISELPR